MRLIPHLLWLLGGVIFLVGFGLLSGASIPYQDPTPDLLEIQRGQIQNAKLIAAVGSSLFVIGVLWVVCRRASARHSLLLAIAISLSACASVSDWRYGSGVCEVHHIAMQTQVVHGLNGCVHFSLDYYGARERSFPNAGIEYGPDLYSPERGKIFVCPQCLKARARRL